MVEQTVTDTITLPQISLLIIYSVIIISLNTRSTYDVILHLQCVYFIYYAITSNSSNPAALRQLIDVITGKFLLQSQQVHQLLGLWTAAPNLYTIKRSEICSAVHMHACMCVPNANSNYQPSMFHTVGLSHAFTCEIWYGLPRITNHVRVLISYGYVIT